MKSISLMLSVLLMSANLLIGNSEPAPNKNMPEKPVNSISKKVRGANIQSNGGSIDAASISNSSNLFNAVEATEAAYRPSAIISNSVTGQIPGANAEGNKTSRENLNNLGYRNLLSSGYDVQIAQQEETGTLWATFTHDISGDGYTDLVVYSSSDNGVTWNYSFYVYNTTKDLYYPDVEAIHDRLLFLYTGYDGTTVDMGVFWVMYDFSAEATTYLVLPDGFDTFEWGSIISDKQYYSNEFTWTYVTYSVWNSETGNGAVYYTRSEDLGITFDNLIMLWQESDHSTDIAPEYYVYRGGLSAAYSTAEPGGPVDHVWTTLAHQPSGDIYVSKIDVYTNEVTSQLVMSGDDYNSHTSPTIAAYFGSVGVFTTTYWLDGYGYNLYNPDVGMTFTYDEGATWGDAYQWYYFIDSEDLWDYSTSPHFSADGALGFGYAAWDETNDVLYRTNRTGSFLSGWDVVRTVGAGLPDDIFKIGSVIHDGLITVVYDNTDYYEIFEIYTASLSLNPPLEDVFFSEYAEGSSNNKYLEIYNGTDATISLDDYVILGNYNGNGWSETFTFATGATLDAGDVYVVANASASDAIQALADEVHAYGAPWYIVSFNGDDVRALASASNPQYNILDIIGTLDTDGDGIDGEGSDDDPGSGWDVAGVSAATKDHTLVRKDAILEGNGGDWESSAGTNADDSEWLVEERPTADYTPPTLGWHIDEPCFDNALAFHMYDSYGDSWNNNTYEFVG